MDALEHEVRLLTSRLAGWVEAQLVQALDDRRQEMTALRSELLSTMDEQLTATVGTAVERAVGYLADHFDKDISAFISGTIARWDAAETASRLELLLGPDLQFVRINGTVVGAIAGLTLHSVSSALS